MLIATAMVFSKTTYTENATAYGLDISGIKDDGLAWSDFDHTFSEDLITRSAEFCKNDTPTVILEAPFIGLALADFDGDGLDDAIDLDDDNDGILDADECLNTNTMATNGNFSGWIYNASWTGTGWNINANRAFYSRWNGTGTKTFEQVITVAAGSENIINFDVGSNASYTNESTLNVKIDGVTQFTESSTNIASTNGGNASNNATLNMGARSFLFTPTTNTVTLTFEGTATANNHDLLYVDNVYITSGCTDFDGDGVPNVFDLDSDNDGIYDVVEAGHDVLSHTDGRLTGAVGTDGVPDAVQNAGQEDSGTVNYTINDADSDGAVDFIALESDSDGCLDVTEAGYSGSSSILGELSGTGYDAITGVVTGNTDGYTTPLDGDGNTTYDYSEAGSTSTITTQPQTVSVVNGSDAIFSAVATGTSLGYQWQLSTDIGINYTDIAGATTSSYTEFNVSSSLEGNFYRVLVTNLSFNCTSTTSDRAILNIAPDNDVDGISDIIDLDDDNDGIPDVDEQNSAGVSSQNDCSGETVLDFSGAAILESGTALQQGAVYRIYNITLGVDALITIVETNNATIGDIDDNGSEASAFRPSTSFDFDNAGDVGYIEYNIKFVNSGTTAPAVVDKFFMNFNDIDGNNNFGEQTWSDNPTNYIISNPTDLTMTINNSWLVATAGTTDWDGSSNANPEANFGVSYVSQSEVSIRVGAVARVAGASANDRQNNIEFSCITNYENPTIYGVDSDSDGLPDYLDLDSDNDGIYDAVEAGHNTAHTNGIVNGSYGANGLADVVETTADSGTINYTISNTDGTGTLDFLDTDSDNDGCNDTNEAYGDANADGGDNEYYGIGNPPSTNANGAVTAASYSVPVDIDTNTVFDFQQVGTVPVITAQPEYAYVVDGATALFSVTATGTNLSYQWQVSTDSATSYTDISGETGTSLTISAASASEDGNYYRVTISDNTLVCASVNSAGGILIISTDTDNDGIVDVVDLDDDNDGIFDTDEGFCVGIYSIATGISEFRVVADDGSLASSNIGQLAIDATDAIKSTEGIAMQFSPQQPFDPSTFTFDDSWAQNATPIFVPNFTTIYNAYEDPDDGDADTDGYANGANFNSIFNYDGYEQTYETIINISNATSYTSFTMAGSVWADESMKLFINGNEVTGLPTTFWYENPKPFSNIVIPITFFVNGDNSVTIQNNDVPPAQARAGILFEAVFEGNGCVNLDTDNDTIIDQFDTDSDDDGCNDAIEAGFTDPDDDGVLGTSPITVDANGLVIGQGGYITPSDNDSNTVFDFQEAGTAPAITAQPENAYVADGTNALFSVTATGTNLNYQWQVSTNSGTNYTDIVGATTNSYTVSNVSVAIDGNFYRVLVTNVSYSCFSIISNGVTLNISPDTDNDGISDVIDLDDDNDGILDTDEFDSCIENGRFAWLLNTVATPFEVDFVSDPQITNWMLASTGTISVSGVTGVSPASDLRLSDINSITFSDALSAGDYVETSFTTASGMIEPFISNMQIGWYDPSQGDSYSVAELISDDNFTTYTILAQDKFVTDDGTIQLFTDLMDGNRFDLKENTTYTIRTYVYGQVDDSPQDYSVWDDHYIIINACMAADTDTDLIPDHLDLDSDNDGIYDAVEAGHNEPQTNGVVNGGYGANGLADVVETYTESGTLNYTITNTDGVDTADFLDTDSDNDGCSDANEAYGDANADGGDNEYYGTGNPPSTNANGAVTAASYSVPADSDANTVFDFQEVGTIATITLQPVNSAICVSCSGNFSVGTTNADTFQWQFFNGTSWVDLSNSGSYTGTTTASLNITNATPSDNGNQYRVLASNSSYICNSEISNAAILTVNVSSVITNRRITHRVKKN